MPIGTVAAGQVLVGGSDVALLLNGAFRGTYDVREESYEPLRQMFMDDIPSMGLTETHAYWETAPYPARWPRGFKRKSKGFKAVRYSIVNKDWEVAVGWHKNDRADDRLGGLEAQARTAGDHFATLPLRVATQIKEASTNDDLLDTIPNAPDGADLYNATDGASADRFGVSGGNTHSGTGVANADMILEDFETVMGRFLQFQNTEGQPLLNPAIIGEGVLIEYPPQIRRVMRQAFISAVQMITINASGAHAATSSVLTGAPIPSPLVAAGDKVTLFENPFLTDANDWYVHLTSNAIVKPLFRQTRQGVENHFATADNNNEMLVSGEESTWWDSREGYGVNQPFGTQNVVVS